MASRSSLHTRALAAIEGHRHALGELSQRIHSTPELGYQEREASERIAAFLEGAGFDVERGYGGLETSYRGNASGRGSGPTVAILSEYDALPDIGHACGHNLIAIMGVAAALGVRAAIDGLSGRIAAIGTPAEEGGGGKVALLGAGGFDDVDVAMMVHPSSRTLPARTSLASNRVDVEFTGRAAHAAAQPDRGLNALEGLIQTFNAVNAMRQHLRSDARVHGIITSGGSAANIIPAYAASKWSVRALDTQYQQEVLRRFIACAEGAAKATGTTVKVTVPENSGYANMVPSTPLAERWAEHLTALGAPIHPATSDERMGSTDMGNVSQVIPAIHPYVAIAPDGTPGHSIEFRDAAATPEAFDSAIAAAKAMALTAVDVLADRSLLESARDEFERRRREGTVRGRP
ncbi:MAG: M20 family metallopeptidase [Chloroflexota bacterium]|nr:M20 family metallopeptidase [Chloroflexota bacterium]MDE3101063.1 M20 family metallopeptidase [Chloroflexota bacterium]